MKENKFKYYYKLIEKDKAKIVMEELLNQYPDYQKELILIKSRFVSNQKKMNGGLQTNENFEVQKTILKADLYALLDSFARQNESRDLDYLTENQSNTPSPVDALLEDQKRYLKSTIKENKVFRTAVALLFLAAVISTTVVGIHHIKFLSKELHVITVLTVNVLLYFMIGVLAFYALSLVIKGSLLNEGKLDFFKRILKNNP